MTGFSYIQKQNYFDLTIPHAVLEVAHLLKHGEVGKFHFLEPTPDSSSETEKHLRIRSRIIVKKLHDGSWNITNAESLNVLEVGANGMIKNVYIIDKDYQDGDAKFRLCEDKNLHEWSRDDVRADGGMMDHNYTGGEDISDIMNEGGDIVDESGALVNESGAMMNEGGLVRNDIGVMGKDEDGIVLVSDGGMVNDGGMVSDGGMAEHILNVIENTEELEESNAEEFASSAKNNEVTGVSISGQHQNKTKEAVDFIIDKDLSMTRSYNSSKRFCLQNCPKCPFCKVPAKDDYNLMRHLKRIHPNHENLKVEIRKLEPKLREKCSECGHMFLNRKTLSEHKQNVHQAFLGIQCPHCGKKYRTRNHLRMHVQYAHLRKDKSFVCEKCSGRFDSKKILETHILYHHTEHRRIYKCDQCDYRYAFQKQYYEHKTRVHGPKKQVCPNCGYKCATRWYMKKHTLSCSKSRSKSTARKQEPIISHLHTIAHLHVPSTIHLGANPNFAPADVANALLEIEQQEMVETDISGASAELPTMWSYADEQQVVSVDEIIQSEENFDEQQMIVIKQEEQCQQFALTGPDGTPHIIQLVFPND